MRVLGQRRQCVATCSTRPRLKRVYSRTRTGLCNGQVSSTAALRDHRSGSPDHLETRHAPRRFQGVEPLKLVIPLHGRTLAQVFAGSRGRAITELCDLCGRPALQPPKMPQGGFAFGLGAAMSCRKSEITVSLPHEQFVPSACQIVGRRSDGSFATAKARGKKFS
jgi:hypothetical protein